MFNPARLSLARRRRGLSQKGFAEALGIDRKTAYRYESIGFDPPPERVAELSRKLHFPEAFFFGADIDEPDQESASFRSMSAMSAKERDAALAAGALAFMLDDWVHERFELPAPDVLDLGREEPEAAARMLRQKWALGEKPVKNMLHLLEAKGVRVFSLVEETRTIDAFSLWRKRKPYVFLNTMKSAERSRFDAAHELGHLILHQHGAPQGREAEEHADRFASAFLMPPADVKAIMPRVHSLHQIVVGKKRWGVSVGALNRQLHRVGAATDWQYRTFAIQISEHGYRTTEPNGLPPEKSVIWQKVLAALWQERTTKNQIAEALSIPPFEIENLVFGLASMTTLDGGATTGGKSRADLRLVGKPDNA